VCRHNWQKLVAVKRYLKVMLMRRRSKKLSELIASIDEVWSGSREKKPASGNVVRTKPGLAGFPIRGDAGDYARFIR